MSQVFTIKDLQQIVDAFAAALDAKNSSMCGHSQRVAVISLAIAKALQLSEAEQQTIYMGAQLHDIGKIGIPDSILNKTGKLTDYEFNRIKEHPVIGNTIVQKVKVFEPICDIIRFHHERYDGNGYPDGLSGKDIPLGARIVAIADSFDAMTMPRPYRHSLNHCQALEEIIRCSGSQFDSALVAVFVKMFRESAVISNNFKDTYVCAENIKPA